MRTPLPPHTLAETPSPRMFWVSFVKPPYPAMVLTVVSDSLTIPAPTDRIIRIPSLLAWASDHRNSQVESGFRTDHHPRINLQRDECYRVHVRVSAARNKTTFPFINTLETPTGIGMRRRSGLAVCRGIWDSAVLGASYLRERSRTASEGYSGLGSS